MRHFISYSNTYLVARNGWVVKTGESNAQHWRASHVLKPNLSVTTQVQPLDLHIL